MSSLVNRFKSSANKAAFEADKLRRVQITQLAIRPLRNEVGRLYSEMGELAYLLYTQEAISHPELCTIGERLAEVHAKISAAEAEVEGIRAEEYIEPPPNETSKSGFTCPNGHGVLAEGTSYCQECGAAGIRPVPPPLPPLPPPATMLCGQCGNTVGLNMRFCPTCGALMGERPMTEQSSNDQNDTSSY